MLSLFHFNTIFSQIGSQFFQPNFANFYSYRKTKFLHMLVKLVLISDTYCIFIVCYTPIATFQKADTCLDA